MVLKETTISPISMKHLVIRIRMTLLTRQDIRLQSPKYWGTKILLGKQMEIFNAGFDFEMFKSRFSGTFEFFNRKTSDMLFSFPLPPSYGYTSYYANIGDMRNRGLELELKGVVMQTKDFYWDINVNLTHYKTK